MRPRSSSTPGRPWFAAALLLSLFVGGCQKPVSESGEIPPATVMVAPARMGSVASMIQTIGTVMPVDASLVASSSAGLVVEMPIRDGQFVRQGEKLAQLREVTVSIRIEEAQALLRQREQEVRRMETGNRPEEVLQSQARVKAAQALSQYSTKRAERAAQSRQQEAISIEELDQSVYEAEQAAQALAEAEAEYQLMISGFRAEDIEAARAARDAQKYIVDQLEDELAQSLIEAPFDGFVTERHTDLGQWVDEGGAVVTLVRLDQVEIRVQVEEDAIQDIRVGQHTEVYVDAIGAKPFDGEIRSIVPKSNWQQGSRSFPVVVRVANKIVDGQPLLKEGMLARIAFHGQPREALLVAKDSIDRSSGQPVVFVVEPDNRVRAVTVRNGMSQGNLVEVEGDLQAGDRLVTEGVERLRPFQKVVIIDNESKAIAPADAQPPAVNSGG